MENGEITKALHKYIAERRSETRGRKERKLLDRLEAVEAHDISFGKEPVIFSARLVCNSTGVAVSSFGGTETQHTVARDYETDEFLIIDGHFGAGVTALKLLYPRQCIKPCLPKAKMEKAAKEYGYQLHYQYFRDLNCLMRDHRLNRYAVNVTSEYTKPPVRPIYAKLEKSDDVLVIGYVYEKNGKECILIEPDIEAFSASEHSFGFIWFILGFIFPPLFLVCLFMMLFKEEKERMVG